MQPISNTEPDSQQQTINRLLTRLEVEIAASIETAYELELLLKETKHEVGRYFQGGVEL